MAIINEPKLQPRKKRAVDNVIITVGLALFSFLLILLTIGLWGATGNYFYNYLFSPDYAQATIEMLIRLVILAVVVFAIMLTWSKYNLKVFGSLTRRRAPRIPSMEDKGALYYIEGEQVALAQSFKSATLDMIEDRLVLCNYEGNCFSPVDPANKVEQ